MRQIIYYVATSIDGFIAGRDGDISGFITNGPGVQQYLEDLNVFDTVIMGRKTYEFGFRYGLKPGEPAYPHMMHYIFSDSLSFDLQHPKVKVVSHDVSFISKLKEEDGRPIYLCGGGDFAAWLLEHQLIDVLKIKLNPIIIGDGVRLFGWSNKKIKTRVIASQDYDDGLKIITYDLLYDS